MSIKSGIRSDARLLGHFLLPSWLSALVSIVVGVIIIGGTIALTHFGSVVQQSLLGLHSAYRHSSVGASTDTVAGRFTHNAALGNVLFFLSWGLVGLVVYSVAQGFVNELKNARDLSRELKYAQGNRQAIVKNVGVRAAIRVVALIILLLAIRLAVYRLVPYAVATAHTGALHLASVLDWLHSLAAGMVCLVGMHVLAVLMRLVFLRPRLLSGEIVL